MRGEGTREKGRRRTAQVRVSAVRLIAQSILKVDGRMDERTSVADIHRFTYQSFKLKWGIVGVGQPPQKLATLAASK